MVGWKDPGADSNGSWNLGVGYEYAGSIKVLGDGITANQPLPSGETQVRFKNRSAGAVIVMISRRFRTGAPQ